MGKKDTGEAPKKSVKATTGASSIAKKAVKKAVKPSGPIAEEKPKAARKPVAPKVETPEEKTAEKVSGTEENNTGLDVDAFKSPKAEKNKTYAGAGPMPEVNDMVTIIHNGKHKAIVTGIHDGERLDVVVQPIGDDAYTLGTVQHKTKSTDEPYWK